MGFREDALKILHQTESSLRELIERALSVQRYSEVADVARFADAVAHLRQVSADGSLHTPSTESAGNEDPPGGPTSQPTQPKLTRRRGRASGFPRFERDGEKLVKIGWSKKDDRVYEHRAPREIVFLVSLAIAGKVKPGAVFGMDQVLPVKDSAGTEVPSYQAYLGLAWLRSIGLVEKRGKEGYVLANGVLDNAKLHRHWNSIPEKH